MAVFTAEMLDFLPPKARAKAILLDEQKDAAYGALRLAMREIEDARDRRERIDRDIRVAESAYLARKGKADSETEEASATYAALAKINLEIKERLQPRHARAAAKWESYAIVDEIGNWLRDAMRARAKLADTTAIRLATRDLPSAVEAARAELADLDAELERVLNAPLPLADVRKAIVAEIEEIAARGSLSLSYVAREVGPLRLDQALGVVNSRRGPRIAETLVALLKSQITASALALVGAIEPEGALTDAQRDAELDRICAARLAVERREEAAITAASAVGIVLARRREADPRAVLGVDDIGPAWRGRADVGLDDAVHFGG